VIDHFTVRCCRPTLFVCCLVGLSMSDVEAQQASPSDSAGREDSTVATLVNQAAGHNTQLPPNLWRRSAGSDWPSFLGPRRNGKSPETGIRTDWSEGLPIVWQLRLGTGYGIGSVSRGRFFQFDRHEDRACLSCLEAETGKALWQFEYPTDYDDMYGYNRGPRCSPVVDGPRVYIYGAEGMLHCLNVSNGELIWRCDTAARFGVIQNFFGVGSTPIVEGDLLIVIVGGSPPEDRQIPRGQLDRVSGNGSGIVAFDKRTGAVRYRLTDQLASYASPVTATIDNRRWCFAFCRGGLVAFEPRSGKIDFQFPWRARKLESVNASTPVVVGQQVFISETYGPGSAMLRVRPGNCEVVWRDELRTRRKAFEAHWSTPIYHQGYLYGCSGRNSPDAQLRCLDWKTGEIQWSSDDGIHSNLLYVDGHFISLEEYGRLLLIKANPQRRELVGQLDVSGWGPSSTPGRGAQERLLTHPCWAAPVLAHGLLYVRGSERLVCLELIDEEGGVKPTQSAQSPHPPSLP